MSQNQIQFPERKRQPKVRTGLTHKQLVKAAYNWTVKNAGVGCTFRELKSLADEIPDVIGFGSWYSVVVECKVSRADFLRDKNKPFRKEECKGMGDYRLYACPVGLIKAEELPPKWGLIYVSEKGRATCVVNPLKGLFGHRGDCICQKDMKSEYRMMYTALRRLFIKGHVETIYDKQYKQGFQAPLIQ